MSVFFNCNYNNLLQLPIFWYFESCGPDLSEGHVDLVCCCPNYYTNVYLKYFLFESTS